jgi:predicted nuclease with TOPRIM domain
MSRTTEEIAKDSIDEYVKGSQFKESLEDMLSDTKKELISNAEKKARYWASIAAVTVIGIFIILVGIQYAGFKEKYADIKNTNADIVKESIEIKQIQKDINEQYEEADKLVKAMKDKLKEMEPKVAKANEGYNVLNSKYSILESNITKANASTMEFSRNLKSIESKMETMKNQIRKK